MKGAITSTHAAGLVALEESLVNYENRGPPLSAPAAAGNTISLSSTATAAPAPGTHIGIGSSAPVSQNNKQSATTTSVSAGKL